MVELDLEFTSTPSADTGSFRLMELPADLAKLVEASSEEKQKRFVIKGQPNEDAVLCTSDKTYTLRSVILSNSVLVVTRPVAWQSKDAHNNIIIRDQLHEVLELTPCLPKLHQLGELLQGQEYDEGEDEAEEGARGARNQPLTYERARSELQASDEELAQGLKDRRILNLRGELRPISSEYLQSILSLLLTHIVSLSHAPESVPIEDLLASLQQGYDVPREVTLQVAEWFGELNEQIWDMDVPRVIREVGIGILKEHGEKVVSQSEFMQTWKTNVGDTFESHVTLKLLSGNYLDQPSPSPLNPTAHLRYFPSSALPRSPADRFTALFAARQRWKADEIAPFLEEIAVDNKERDQLLLKFARGVSGEEGVWYTSRFGGGK